MDFVDRLGLAKVDLEPPPATDDRRRVDLGTAAVCGRAARAPQRQAPEVAIGEIERLPTASAIEGRGRLHEAFQSDILSFCQHHDLSEPKKSVAPQADAKSGDHHPQVAARGSVALCHPEGKLFAIPGLSLPPPGDLHFMGERRIIRDLNRKCRWKPASRSPGARQPRRKQRHSFGSDCAAEIDHHPGRVGGQAMKSDPLAGLGRGQERRQRVEFRHHRRPSRIKIGRRGHEGSGQAEECGNASPHQGVSSDFVIPSHDKRHSTHDGR